MTGLAVKGSLDDLVHDWYVLRTYLQVEARATHYADGTPLVIQQHLYASQVLSMLKCEEIA